MSATCIVTLFAFRATPVLAQDVLFDVETSTGNDTLFVGVPGTINFTVDANGNEVSALDFSFEMVFSASNVIGPLTLFGNVNASAAAVGPVFEVIAWNSTYGQGTDPDTIMYGFIDLGGPLWDGSGTVWSIDVTATGSGSVRFDSILTPLANVLSAVDVNANDLPIQYLFDGQAVEFVYPPGDVNSSGTINSSDVIHLVNFVFKSGPAPSPLVLGDVNASCAITSSDIIYLVAYIFKGGPPPLVGCA